MVYEAAARVNLSPPVVDELDLWVLASALGANRVDEADAADLRDAQGFTWNQRRAIALETGQPEPTWDDAPMSPAEQDSLLRSMPGGGGMMLAPPPEVVTDA